MKNLKLPQLRIVLISILLFNASHWTFAQVEFLEPTINLSKENDAEVKKHIKSYKTFEFDVKELKKLLREKKGIESPSEFTINLNGEKTKFTVFENDILDDNFVEYQDGKIVKYKGEISTYADNTKVVAIPPDNNSYVPLLSSNFSYSNPSVFVFCKTLNNTSFALGSVNSFTLNVSAFDGCLNYYWGVPFVYSAAGARVATAYPNPSDDELTIESSEETPFNVNEVEQVKILLENNQEEVADFKFLNSKIRIRTENLKAGLKYLKIYLKNGEVITKRILVSHE